MDTIWLIAQLASHSTRVMGACLALHLDATRVPHTDDTLKQHNEALTHDHLEHLQKAEKDLQKALEALGPRPGRGDEETLHKWHNRCQDELKQVSSARKALTEVRHHTTNALSISSARTRSGASRKARALARLTATKVHDELANGLMGGNHSTRTEEHTGTSLWWTLRTQGVRQQDPGSQTCGAHTIVHSTTGTSSTTTQRQRAWRTAQRHITHSVRRGQAAEEEAGGNNISVTTMAATAPADRVQSGELLTIDSSDMLTRGDATWIPEASKRRLRQGLQIVLRIRSTDPALGTAHWHTAKIRKTPDTDNGMECTILDSQASHRRTIDWWNGAFRFRATVDDAMANTTALPAPRAAFPTHEISVINAMGDTIFDAVHVEPTATLGGIWRAATKATTHPDTILTSLGPWPATTRIEEFGAITGVRNASRGAEGTLIIRTDLAQPQEDEHLSTKPIDIHVVESGRGDGGDDTNTPRVHTLNLTAHQYKHHTPADIAHAMTGDAWIAIQVATASEGSRTLLQPDTLTLQDIRATTPTRYHLILIVLRPGTVHDPPSGCKTGGMAAKPKPSETERVAAERAARARREVARCEAQLRIERGKDYPGDTYLAEQGTPAPPEYYDAKYYERHPMRSKPGDPPIQAVAQRTHAPRLPARREARATRTNLARRGKLPWRQRQHHTKQH